MEDKKWNLVEVMADSIEDAVEKVLDSFKITGDSRDAVYGELLNRWENREEGVQ